MKVAIHQPNYLPWAGYFLKMALCDVFVFHDNVQITKSGPTRRVKITANHTADHTQWLTVPLKKHSDFELIKNLEISWQIDWTRSHLAKIHNTYRKFPNFDFIYSTLELWYRHAKSMNNVSELNIYLIMQIASLLRTEKKYLRSSDLLVSGKADEYNKNICISLGATEYLSGMGGIVYQNESDFLKNGINLKIIDARKLLISFLENVHATKLNPSCSIIELMMYFKNMDLLTDFVNNNSCGKG